MMFSLDSITRVLEISLGCGAVILLLLALTPLLSKRLSPKWRYAAWLLLALRLVFFGGSLPDFRPPFRPLIRLEVPQAVVQNTYDPREDHRRDWELARQEGDGISSGGTTDMNGTYYRYYIRYRDESGRDISIENGEFFRTVTVDGVSVRSIHWTAAAALGWFLTAAGCYAASLGSYFQFRKRTLRWSSPAGEADKAALAVQLERQGVKNRPELYRCPLIHSPLLMGFHHPVILLPEDLPADALEAALAHEVRHLKRKDTGYLNFLILARSVHWFNPLVWVMVRRARQDAELCCDYDLLKDQGEDARRSYGQTILDQMTAGRREGPSLTTGFSGSKAEVFRRFRAIMDLSPKRWGRTALALAACATLLAGGLVTCGRTAQTEEITASTPQFTGRTGGPSTYLVHGGISSDLTFVEYERVDWFDRDDEQAETAWWLSHWESGWLEALTAPLAPEAELLYYFGDRLYPLSRSAIEYSVWQAQDGALMEITLDGAGQVARLALRGGVSLDLDAAGLNFTGYSGLVYSRSRPTEGTDGTVSFVPCSSLLQEGSGERYTLPAGESVDLERLDRSPVSGYYVLKLENGMVLWVEDYLEFSDVLDHWNAMEDLDFPNIPHLTASLGIHSGPGRYENLPCYRFENAQLGILLEVFQSVRYWEGDRGYDCLLSYGGRSEEFQLPNLPLAPFRYGHVAGECEFYLSDLTGDGVPELIFIDGYHQSGAGFDSCRVFDPAAMEEYNVFPEQGLQDMLATLRLELVERQGETMLFQLSGPGGVSGPVHAYVPEGVSWGGGAVVDNCYSIGLNGDGTALELRGTVQTAASSWTTALGEISGTFVFVPSEKAFRVQGAFRLTLSPEG